MTKMKALTLLIGSPAILVTILTSAHATMPLLTTLPKQPTLAACQKWAATQSVDAIEMWGTQLSGEPSLEVALIRLTHSCMGDDEPEIVGF